MTASGLPKRVNRLGPVIADAIQPTGPVPKLGLLAQPPATAQGASRLQQGGLETDADMGAVEFPVLPSRSAPDAPRLAGVTRAPDNTIGAPPQVFPNAARSAQASTVGPSAVDMAAWPPPSPAGYSPSVDSLEPHAHQAVDARAASIGSGVTVVSVPPLAAPNHAPNGSPHSEPDPLLAAALHAEAPIPQAVPVTPHTHDPSSASTNGHGEALVATVDWRFIAFTALLAGYLPLLVRSLLGVRLSHPLGTTVVALLMVPLAFTVISARRPRRTTIDDRHVDLVVGTVTAIMSLAATWVLPSSLGGSSPLWRAEWIALPFALFSIYTLLWGVRFAWDMRNSLLIALLASPVFFVPLLGRSFAPLSGAINPFAVDAAGAIVELQPAGPSQFLGGAPQRTLDARGLVDGRVGAVGVLVVLLALLLVSRVDQRSVKRGGNGPASGLTRRARKAGALIAALATFWVVDLIISALALVVAGVLPPDFARYPVSPLVGVIPSVAVLATFRGWCSRCGLFLPSRVGVLNSATKLPAHGPKSKSDHAITFAVLALLTGTATMVGLRPSLEAVTSLAPGVDLASTVAATEWQPGETTPVTGFESYFGTHAEWVRTGLNGPANAQLDQVNVDRISASVDVLRMFSATSTYELGKFRPVASRKIDLGAGAVGLQETYYDSTTATAWSVASVLFETGSGTHRLSISARAAGDTAPVPLPKASATRNLLVRTSEPAPGIGKQLKEEKISRTSDAVAELFRSYVSKLQAGAVTPVGSGQVTDEVFAEPDVVGMVADDPGFIE